MVTDDDEFWDNGRALQASPFLLLDSSLAAVFCRLLVFISCEKFNIIITQSGRVHSSWNMLLCKCLGYRYYYITSFKAPTPDLCKIWILISSFSAFKASSSFLSPYINVRRFAVCHFYLYISLLLSCLLLLPFALSLHRLPLSLLRLRRLISS